MSLKSIRVSQCQGPRHLGHYLLPPRTRSRKLGWKWSLQDWNKQHCDADCRVLRGGSTYLATLPPLHKHVSPLIYIPLPTLHMCVAFLCAYVHKVSA